MLCIAVNFILLIFSTSVYGLNNFGCLNQPQTCPPPNICHNDGLNGNCISEKQDTNTDEYRLYQMVRHVQSYLHSQNKEFSDLSESQLNELASEMARLFLKEKENNRKKRTQRLISMLLDEKRRLAQQGVKLGQLTKEQKQDLIDTVVEKYKKSQEKIDESPISQPSSDAVDSYIVEEKSSEQNSIPQDIKAKHAPLSSSRTSSDEDSGEDAVEAELPLQSKNANPGVEDTSFDQVKDGPADDGDPVISKVETRGDEDIPQELPTENLVFAEKQKVEADSNHEEATYIVVIIIVAVLVVCIIIIAITVYCMKSNRNKNKLLNDVPFHSGKDYQALCRQHYASKSGETTEVKQSFVSPRTHTNSATPTKVFSPITHQRPYHDTESRHSSISSWSEEPVTSSMDILTGHAVLNYMEDHLKNKDRLALEWEGLCNYKAENVSTAVAQANPRKNRFTNAVPYDGNRVKLNVSGNALESDYINASFIIDNDPRWPVYIATQGPLSSTIHDFWQMVWEQGVTVIVMLTPLIEEGISQCARYWPDELEGSTTYGNYEIHLVSEHVWRDDYLVRSLYLKNLISGHTRTVTQFHFLSWPKNGIPTSSKQLLELRRKVSKCYRGNSLSPAVVHCSDGCGRTGSYILIDLVLARILKGTSKEIDIAATLEHLRDQRAGGMVSSKEQLKFTLNCVADEVNAILKAIQ